jgi:hypothetical protein
MLQSPEQANLRWLVRRLREATPVEGWSLRGPPMRLPDGDMTEGRREQIAHSTRFTQVDLQLLLEDYQRARNEDPQHRRQTRFVLVGVAEMRAFLLERFPKEAVDERSGNRLCQRLPNNEVYLGPVAQLRRHLAEVLGEPTLFAEEEEEESGESEEGQGGQSAHNTSSWSLKPQEDDDLQWFARHLRSAVDGQCDWVDGGGRLLLHLDCATVLPLEALRATYERAMWQDQALMRRGCLHTTVAWECFLRHYFAGVESAHLAAAEEEIPAAAAAAASSSSGGSPAGSSSLFHVEERDQFNVAQLVELGSVHRLLVVCDQLL